MIIIYDNCNYTVNKCLDIQTNNWELMLIVSNNNTNNNNNINSLLVRIYRAELSSLNHKSDDFKKRKLHLKNE